MAIGPYAKNMSNGQNGQKDQSATALRRAKPKSKIYFFWPRLVMIKLCNNHDHKVDDWHLNGDDDSGEYDDNVIDKVWLEGHKNPQERGQDLFVGGL